VFWFRRRETQGEPALRVAVHQNARDFLIDPDEFVADSVCAINATKQAIELVVRDGFLKFLERFPARWIGQGMAQVIGRASRNVEENGENEEDSAVQDHRLDFRLFNTMLARC